MEINVDFFPTRSTMTPDVYTANGFTRSLHPASSKMASHFNDTVEIHLIKRDGYTERRRLSHHLRTVVLLSVHYDAQIIV